MFWGSGTSSTNVVTFWLKLAFMRFMLIFLFYPPFHTLYIRGLFLVCFVYTCRITSFTFSFSCDFNWRLFRCSVTQHDHFVFAQRRLALLDASNAFPLPRDNIPSFILILHGSEGGKYDHQTIGIKLMTWIKQIFVASKLDLTSAVEKE